MVELVPAVRNCKHFFEKAPIHIIRGMKDDVTGAHVWLMMGQEDLPARPKGFQHGAKHALEPDDLPTRVPHPQDVVCVIKRHVWMTMCSQQPVVILPVQDHPLSAIPIRPRNRPKHADKLLRLAARLEEMYSHDPHYLHAVQYFRQLSFSRIPDRQLWPLPFHERCFRMMGLRIIASLPTSIFLKIWFLQQQCG